VIDDKKLQDELLELLTEQQIPEELRSHPPPYDWKSLLRPLGKFVLVIIGICAAPFVASIIMAVATTCPIVLVIWVLIYFLQQKYNPGGKGYGRN